MSEVLEARPPRRDPPAFGFKVERSEGGWRWSAFDPLGRVAGEGLAPTRAMAAAEVIDALSRT